ncbi:radical SAM protein [uncultured Arcticibacterium sp.]|uniref:radical SAM protein n=1 Tax=uncultured Arcticibacterium sp. TaxID=2173042 RepID=UPI0030F99A8A
MITKEHLRHLNAKLYPKHIGQSPSFIVLGVNNLCNLHCKMCDVGVRYNNSNFYTNLMGTDPVNMPIKLLKKIIDETAEFFPEAKLGYAFTEPLIYPHLEESLAYAKEKGIETSLTTNAFNLKAKAKMLASNGLKELCVSLDGPPEIHNEIRQNKRSFQRAMEGIELLLAQENCPSISVYCVITEWNIGYLKEMLEIFKDIPLKNFGFMHSNFTTEPMVAAHQAMLGEQYPATQSNISETNIESFNTKLLLEEIRSIKVKKYPFSIGFSPEMETLDELNTFYLNPSKPMGKLCLDSFKLMMIKSDGSVIPNHGRCYNLDVGNVYKNSLNEIWNSPAFGNFRTDLVKAGGLFPACNRCCSAFEKPFWS